MQRDALFNALIEILRTISDKGKVTMVLPSEDEVLVDHSASYFHDTITEKVCVPQFRALHLLLIDEFNYWKVQIFLTLQLYVFTLSPNEELEHFMKRNLKYVGILVR